MTPPQDPEAIEILSNAFMESKGDMRHILRTLFNSDFFKEAREKKVKSPTELVTGILKLVGTYQRPDLGLAKYSGATTLMGQKLLDPPTVEGWHTGREWVDGGTLTERVNFAVREVSDASRPGIGEIIDRLKAEGRALAPDEFVEKCLDLAGPMIVSDTTRESLSKFAESGGDLDLSADNGSGESTDRVVQMLQLIVASREYQFA